MCSCNNFGVFFFIFDLICLFFFKLYNIVLVLPNIEMNLPQVYLCSPSWTLLPPIPSLWVIPVHQPQASRIVHQTWTGNSFHTWYFTCFNAILYSHGTFTFICKEGFLSVRKQSEVTLLCLALKSIIFAGIWFLFFFFFFRTPSTSALHKPSLCYSELPKPILYMCND